MRVILDGSEVYERWGSSFRYFQALIPRLSKFPDVRVDLIPSPTNALGQSPKAGVSSWFPQGKLRAWLGYQKKRLATLRYMKRTATSEPTLYHSYYYSLPPDPNVPMVSVYLDLIPELFKKEFNAGYYDSSILLKERTVRRSARIIAISEKTKADLCGYYGISSDQVDVVYFGIDAAFFAQPHTPVEAEAFRRQLGLPEHYLFYLGGRTQHKNFVGWAEAYAKFPGRKDYAFVVAGPAFQPEESSFLKKLGVTPHHINIPDEPALRMLYKLSDVFIYPSLYEGMGLPPLEAMASGTPVAAARAGAIPEVSGEGAEYFDPRNAQDIHRAIERCLDPVRRAQLIEKGRFNVVKYSWDSAAEKTVAAYRKVLS